MNVMPPMCFWKKAYTLLHLYCKTCIFCNKHTWLAIVASAVVQLCRLFK